MDGLVTRGTPEDTTVYPGPPPLNRPRYTWREAEAARTPARFRERVLTQFRSAQNVAYLRQLLARTAPAGKLRQFAVDTTDDAVQNYDVASDLLMSDSLARRGFASRSANFWDELRRLNRAFFDFRMGTLVREAAAIDPTSLRDGIGDSDEPYHIMMFTADSLRPPGLEFLNDPGPAWALREDQTTWESIETGRNSSAAARSGAPTGAARSKTASKIPPATVAKSAAPRARRTARSSPPTYESFVSKPGARRNAAPPAGMLGAASTTPNAPPAAPNGAPKSRYGEAARGSRGAFKDFAIAETPQGGGHEDDAWDEGDPNRTAEEALAEYWGDSHAETSTQLGSKEQAGVSYGSQFAWGDAWQENGGSRLMRYERPPFWQKGGREGYDYDIEETLGTQMREADNHVRRWDMSRLIYPQGQQYRTFGPRTGPIV